MTRAANRTTALSASAAVATALAIALAFLALPAAPAHAETGTVYSCAIVPCYRHPVTNEIEDAGGEAGYATGLGMVESCIFSSGMMEVSDSGSHYLTIRIGLLDYSSGHTFQVQEWGAATWSNPRLTVTGSGADANGTTEDVCLEVPGQACVVRITMFVEPMGRNVICYCYPKDFVAGQPDGMAATMVTAPSPAQEANSEAGGRSSDDSTTPSADSEPMEASSADASGAGAAPASTADQESADGSPTATADELAGQTVSRAQGLLLSTAPVTTAASSGGGIELELPEQAATAIIAALSAACVFAAGSLALFAAFRHRLRAYDADDYSHLYGEDDA